MPINRGSTKLANCPFFITNRFIFTFQSIVLHLLQCRATFYQVNVERLSEINKLCWALLKWTYALRNRTVEVRQRRDTSKKTIHEVNLPREFLVLGQAQSNSPSLVAPFAPTDTSPTHQSAEAKQQNIIYSYLISHSIRSTNRVNQPLVKLNSPYEYKTLNTILNIIVSNNTIVVQQKWCAMEVHKHKKLQCLTTIHKYHVVYRCIVIHETDSPSLCHAITEFPSVAHYMILKPVLAKKKILIPECWKTNS